MKCFECRFFDPKTNICSYKSYLTLESNWCYGFIQKGSQPFAGISNEEEKACIKLIQKMREEEEQKKQKELIQKYKHNISSSVADAISVLGLEETKRIVRELNRELREY